MINKLFIRLCALSKDIKHCNIHQRISGEPPVVDILNKIFGNNRKRDPTGLHADSFI